MSHVVLVHGAWSDGSIWQDVIRGLQDRGHDALAVQLPMTSLADDIEWTRRHLRMLDPPVTLVGHSYGGMVTSAAATGDSPVRSLVFVAAYAPDQSESVVTLSGQGAAMPGRDAIRFGEDGWTTVDPARFHDALGYDLPLNTTNMLAAVQKPTHVDCLVAPAGLAAWQELPCSYVVSTHDNILDPALQRWFADRANADVTQLPSGHLSLISHAHQVAVVIDSASHATS